MKSVKLIFSLLAGWAILFTTISAASYTPTASLGVCNDNTTCTIENSYCDHEEKFQCNLSVCICLPDYVAVSPNPLNPTEIYCLPKAKDYGENCTDDLQCKVVLGDLSRCTTNPANNTKTCQCTPETVYCEGNSYVPKQCRQKTKNLGDACDKCNFQCGDIPNAICKVNFVYDEQSRCYCNTSYTQVDETSRCVPLAEKMTDKCDNSPKQCDGVKESVCLSDTKTCVCNNETHIPSAGGKRCLPKREHLNMICEVDEQCLPENSACIRYFPFDVKVCTCDRGFEESPDSPSTCFSNRRSGESCTDNLQCTNYMGDNAECSGSHNMTCQCKHGFLNYGGWNPGFGYCLPFIPVGKPCHIAHAQCVDATGSSDNTFCVDRVCSCTGSKLHDGICYRTRMTGDGCEKDVECKLWISGPVVCSAETKKCTCDLGYLPSDNRLGCVPDEKY